MSKWISVKDRLPDYSARKRGMATMPFVIRLMINSKENPKTGCWEWCGSKRNGYGRLIVGSRTNGTRKSVSAHRASYDHFVGKIPAGLPRDNVMVSVYNRRIDAIDAAIRALGRVDFFET